MHQRAPATSPSAASQASRRTPERLSPLAGRAPPRGHRLETRRRSPWALRCEGSAQTQPRSELAAAGVSSSA